MQTRSQRATMSTEDVILSHDRRGISALRRHLPADFCREAAAFVLESKKQSQGPAIITTGFYIADAGAAETDGPPGALAIGRALHSLGFSVIYVTDKHALPLLSGGMTGKDEVIEFPITDHSSSQRFAEHILNNTHPSLLISIERCGLNIDHQYLNMAGEDITEHTAKVDYIFSGRCDSLGIGDGGNEIGMGNLAAHMSDVETLPRKPALTRVSRLIIASVSNWGVYGLIGALSRMIGQDLLPPVEWEKETIQEMVARGAVDGVSGQKRTAVDSFDPDRNAWALTRLHALVRGMP
jgi:hypothetical protein